MEIVTFRVNSNREEFSTGRLMNGTVACRSNFPSVATTFDEIYS